MHDRVLVTGGGRDRNAAPFAASFLVRPERFPETLSGARSGDRAADLPMPAGPYRVRGLGAVEERLLGERFGGFCAPATAAEAPVEIDLFPLPAAAFRREVVPGWHYSFDLDPGPARVRLAGWGFCAVLERRTAGAWRAGLWLAPGDRQGFLGTFTNVLRVLAAYRLLDAGGVLLHGATVVRGGAATVFVGRSGAGKSTVSGQARARGLEVLSDEMAALVGSPAGAASGTHACAVPFAGDLEPLRTPRPPLPLGRLLLLEQAERDALMPASTARAVAAAAACAPWINADPHRTAALLATLESLLAGVPVARLEFTRGGCWPLLGTAEAA